MIRLIYKSHDMPNHNGEADLVRWFLTTKLNLPSDLVLVKSDTINKELWFKDYKFKTTYKVKKPTRSASGTYLYVETINFTDTYNSIKLQLAIKALDL